MKIIVMQDATFQERYTQREAIIEINGVRFHSESPRSVADAITVNAVLDRIGADQKNLAKINLSEIIRYG